MAKSENERILIKFGKHIAALREEKNLAQMDIYYICGMDDSRLSKIEQGKINITFLTICQLASALGVSRSELVDFSE